MKNILICILLIIISKKSISQITKPETRKLLISEEIYYSDSTKMNVQPFGITKYTYNDNNQLISEESQYQDTFAPNHTTYYTYDNDGYLIEKVIIKKNKTDTINYIYINNIPSYSFYKGSKKHSADYFVKGNKIIRVNTHNDSLKFIFTYKQNNLSQQLRIFKKGSSREYFNYGNNRNAYYGRNFKWQDYDVAVISENEVLENEKITNNNLEHNNHIFIYYSHTYNDLGYPMTETSATRDNNSNIVKSRAIILFKYIPAK